MRTLGVSSRWSASAPSARMHSAILSVLVSLVAACRFPELPAVMDDGDAGDGSVATRHVTVALDPQVGGGRVTATTVGIDCGEVCTADVPDGAPIAFMATPSPGMAFVGWRDGARGCGARSTCTVGPAGGDLVVGARFAAVGQAAWIQLVGGLGAAEVVGVVSDTDDSVVVAARYLGEATLDGEPHPNPAGYDLLLARISPAGDVLWQRAFQSASTLDIAAIALEPATHDIAILGSYSATVDLGGTQPLQLAVGDTKDHFVARLHAGGEVYWQREIHASDDDDPGLGGIAFDSSGDVVVLGGFQTLVDLGDGPLTSSGGELFLAKLAANDGHVIWKRKIGGPDSFIAGTSLAVASNGTVYVGGRFAGSCTLGGTALSPSGLADGFIGEYLGGSGTFRSQVQVGGSGSDGVEAMAIAASAVIAAVSYEVRAGEAVTFAGTPAGGTGGSLTDIVVAQAVLGSHVVWARRFGSAGHDGIGALTVLPDLSVGLVGSLQGDTEFGATVLTGSGSGVSDGFFARLNGATGVASYASAMPRAAVSAVGATSTSVVVGGSIGSQSNFFGRTVNPEGGGDGVLAGAVLPP